MIKNVWVEKDAEKHPFTQEILSRLGDASFLGNQPDIHYRRPEFRDFDKQSLCLVPFKGEFLKPCPGTKNYICCGYQILNIGLDCPLDCTYCILQAYFNASSPLKVFINLKQELNGIIDMIKTNPDQVFRIGTGEFTDSLALDSVMKWSQWLVPLFSRLKNAALELKTKTDQIEGVLAAPARDRIILAWSLNTSFISSREEKGACSLKKRILAARRCQDEGFALGFHFDPIILHPHWKDGYQRTIELLDRYINPARIIWISLGTMRYMPGLKEIIRKRHPQTHILDGEFIVGRDGKMRYFKPIRIELYREISRLLRDWSKGPLLYLCMESDEIWQKSLGWTPNDSTGLRQYLDDRVKSFFA